MNFIFVGLPGNAMIACNMYIYVYMLINNTKIGAGKGTFAKIMSKELNLFHFSLGDAMREEIKSATEFGKKVSSYVAKG